MDEFNEGSSTYAEARAQQIAERRAAVPIKATQREPLVVEEQPLLIGLGGLKEAGKDTVADFLVSDYGFQKLNMSDPLAQALYTLNPIVDMHFEDYDLFEGWVRDNGIVPDAVGAFERYRDVVDIVGYTQAKRIPEVRRLLQVLGTEVGRDILGDDIWVQIATRSITEIRQTGVPVAITGIRYPNELAMVRNLGGIEVWVDRPELAQNGVGANLLGAEGSIGTRVIQAIDDAISTERLQYHSSEVTLTKDDFNVRISNDDTLETLRTRTGNLLEVFAAIKDGRYPVQNGDGPEEDG